MDERSQAEITARPRSSNRGARIALIGLVEVALVALIVVVLLGRRVAAVADVVEQVPGRQLAVAGGGVVLLLIAALVMTFHVSD